MTITQTETQENIKKINETLIDENGFMELLNDFINDKTFLNELPNEGDISVLYEEILNGDHYGMLSEHIEDYDGVEVDEDGNITFQIKDLPVMVLDFMEQHLEGLGIGGYKETLWYLFDDFRKEENNIVSGMIKGVK